MVFAKKLGRQEEEGTVLEESDKSGPSSNTEVSDTEELPGQVQDSLPDALEKETRELAKREKKQAARGKEQAEEKGEAEEAEAGRVPCPECGETYADERGLAVHMARKHRKKEQPEGEPRTRNLAKTEPCPVCGRRLAPQGLSRHMEKHAREREAEAGAELAGLIQQPVSEAVEQILEQVPKIADQLLKNEDLLLRALQSNGWKLKVMDEKLIILVK